MLSVDEEEGCSPRTERTERSGSPTELCPLLEPLEDGAFASLPANWGSIGQWERRGAITYPRKRKSGRNIPYKLLLSLAICAILTVEVFIYSTHHNTMVLDTTEAFQHWFLPEGHQNNVAELASLEETTKLLQRTVTNYYNLKDVLPGVFNFCGTNNSGETHPKPVMTIQYWQGSKHMLTIKKTSCNISIFHPYGPLAETSPDCESPTGIAENVLTINVSFCIKTVPLVALVGETFAGCSWRVEQIYDISHVTGKITVTLDATYMEVRRTSNSLLFWSKWLLMVLAMWDIMVLCEWNLYNLIPFRSRYMVYTKGTTINNTVWHNTALVADGITLLSGIVCYLTFFVNGSWRSIGHFRWLVLGSACLTQYFVLVSYLEHDPRLYLLFNTLRAASPRLGLFILSCMPTFMAFTLFGMVMFGKTSPFFKSIGEATATLFAILNGDSINDVFISTQDGSAPLGALVSGAYMFVYVTLAIYVVANVGRVIIVEAYDQTSGVLCREMENRLAHTPSRGTSLTLKMPKTRSRLNSEGTGYDRHPSPHVPQPQPQKMPFYIGFGFLLCCAVTWDALDFCYMHNSIIQDTVDTLKKKFLPDNVEGADMLESYQTHLYSYHSAMEHMDATVVNFHTLHNDMPYFYSYDHERGKSLDLRAKLMNAKGVESVVECPLSLKNTRGPLGSGNKTCPSIRHQKEDISVVTVTFQFFTRPTTADSLQRRCLRWNVMQTYDFTTKDGVIPVTIKIMHAPCPVSWRSLWRHGTFWVKFLLLVGNITQLYLTGKRGKRSARRLALKYTTIAVSLLWVIISVIMEEFRHEYKLFDAYSALLAMACVLNWILLTSYLDHYRNFRSLTYTCRYGFPVVLNFVVGAIPPFMGYCLFGTTVFGHISYHFRTIQDTAITLFSVLNGDVVLDIFHQLDHSSAYITIVSRTYLYTFIPFMFYNMVNIFLVITEEAYRHSVQKVTREPSTPFTGKNLPEKGSIDSKVLSHLTQNLEM